MNTQLINKNNISFNVVSSNFSWFWENTESKHWDELPLPILDRFMEKNKIFIDIGAWIGATTLYCADRASKIFSFEPDPVAFESLRGNINLNPKLEKKILITNSAITASGGKVKLHIRYNTGDAGSSILPAIHSSGGFIEVDSLTFGDYLNNNEITEIGLIKIDIEAGEFFILPSIIKDLKKLDKMPHLCVEFHYSKLIEFYYQKVKTDIKPAFLGKILSFIDRKLGINLMSKRAKTEADKKSKEIINILSQEYAYVYNQMGEKMAWNELMGYLGNVAITNESW